MSLLTIPTTYGLYVDDSLISEEFGASLAADSIRDWEILTRCINNLVIKNKKRTIMNVVLTDALTTDAGFQQAVKKVLY